MEGPDSSPCCLSIILDTGNAAVSVVIATERLFHKCGNAASPLLKGKYLPCIFIHGDMPLHEWVFLFCFVSIANCWFCSREKESLVQVPGLSVTCGVPANPWGSTTPIWGCLQQVVVPSWWIFLAELSLEGKEELVKAALNCSWGYSSSTARERERNN